jgi:hypothetical protein
MLATTPDASGLARLSIDPAHDALHAAQRHAVQGLLEVGAKKLRRGSVSEIGVRALRVLCLQQLDRKSGLAHRRIESGPASSPMRSASSSAVATGQGIDND